MIKELLKKIKQGFLPIWCFGLECNICQKSFLTPEDHYNYVKKFKEEYKHKDKIPKLMED